MIYFSPMKYMDIYAALNADIANQAFEVGKRLPGEPELCRRFGVARNTVRQALSLLQRQGLIEKRKGEGTFITKRGERKTGIIGLLMPNLASTRFFYALKKELEGHARSLGYSIVTEQISSGTAKQAIDSARKAARRLAVKRVEGIIFRPHIDPRCTEGNHELLHIFRRTETPVVLIDSDVTQPPERSACDLVAVDNIGAGRRIAAHLIAGGRRRIAAARMTQGTMCEMVADHPAPFIPLVGTPYSPLMNIGAIAMFTMKPSTVTAPTNRVFPWPVKYPPSTAASMVKYPFARRTS